MHRAVRRVPRRVIGAVALLAVLTCAIVGLGASLGAAPSRAATSLKQIPGSLPGLDLATLLSPTPATRTLQIGVGISHPDPAGEQALYNAMYDSSSPLYHHFLSVREFDARFGVRPATTAAVRNYLTSGGLSIQASSAGGDYFLATGTVAQLDRLFHVQIGDYSYRGVDFLSDDTAPSVPAGLPIDAIAGLENLTHFSVDKLTGGQLAEARSAAAAVKAGAGLLTGTAQARSAAVHAALGSPVTVSNEGTEQTYTPQDLWGFYNAPGASQLTNANGLSTPSTVQSSHAALGQGQIMGVFTEGEDSSVIRNLRLFESATGLPKVPARIVETEGGPDSAYSDNSGAEEWYLDSQSSTGMAPDVSQLDLFTAKTFQDADVADEFNYWANDATGPREMNASFGECEQNPTEPATGPLSNLPAGVALGGDMEQLADPSLKQAAMEGRTLFASAGDTGSGCATLVAPVLGAGNGIAIQPVPFQSYPCISDYAVCVGGTTPSSKGAGYPAAAQRSNEQAWTYTGGGSSYFNPAPDYQSGVKNITQTCVSNDTGATVYAPGTAPLCRGVPDVAVMSGGGNDWFFFYNDGQPSIEGGTSLASPLMMGQWARAQAAASAATQKAGGLGYANPVFYKQAASADSCTTAPCTGTYARDFNDITQGEDAGDVVGGQTGMATTGTGVGLSNGVYSPGPGWDYVSGWGSLNDANFIQDVDGTTNATDSDSGAEQAAASVCTASMTGISGNATDPISSQNDPGLNVTAASLSTSGSNIVATLTVPDLSAGLPLTTLAGAKFMVGWEYNGVFYYGAAEETAAGTFSYEAGNTGAPFSGGLPQNNPYDDTAAVSGSANTSSGQITITVPAADVGSPAAGAALQDPQAFVVGEVATLGLTIDSADTLRNASLDDGQLDSIGVNVILDGTSGSTCSNTLPATSVTTARTGVLASGSSPSGKDRGPTTRITHSKLTRTGLALSGTATAYDGHRVSAVSVAIARATTRKLKHGRELTRCAFLTSRHTWTKPGSCTPRDYERARGATRWSFRLTKRLGAGAYLVWERARDNHGLSTHNTASKHVFFRLK